MGSSRVQTAPRETLGQGQAILDFYARQGGGYPMGVGQLSESDAVDALRLPFYSSSHPTGSHGWRNQFDLGNPDLDILGAGWTARGRSHSMLVEVKHGQPG